MVTASEVFIKKCKILNLPHSVFLRNGKIYINTPEDGFPSITLLYAYVTRSVFYLLTHTRVYIPLKIYVV